MTIDSTWLQAFKDDSPHAFTPAAPFRPSAVFVDGQIKLMQSIQREPITWDTFIHRQFTRHLCKWFEVSDTVVLAFDNYEHVPRAKCMTQAKRRKHTPPINFGEHSELPPMVPDGEHWAQCIANRAFKVRVIDLVILRLPHLLLSKPEARERKRLIIDYQQPHVFWFNENEGRVNARVLDGMQPLGEADVKFTRYADEYGKLLVDSIDGDSVPIALMHLEHCLRSSTPRRIPEVCIYRMELRLVKTERTAGTKRASPDPEAALARRERRTYEFVNVNALYQGLKQAIAQSIGRVTTPSHALHEMAMLVCLIGLTGTDFSRPLPQLSGKTLFRYLPDVWGTLMASYDPVRQQLNVEAAANLLVAHIYRTKFCKHTKACSEGSIVAVLSQLKGDSKLGARIKASFPGPERVVCTVRNVNWILQYWGWTRDDPLPPDPVQAEYGFTRLSNGATDYADIQQAAP
jgi:hypothetical protein